MKNRNSLNAYFNPENVRKFNSHRGMIIRELSANPRQHSYQIAAKLGITNEAVKKRLSDLKDDGLICTCGDVDGKALYKLFDQLTLFDREKLTLKKWLKFNHREIFEQYERL